MTRGAHDGDALLLASGKLEGIGVPLAVQPNALEKGFRLVCCLLSAGASRFNRGDGDIFQNGQVREKIEMLENHAYVLAELIDVRSGRGNQLSLETDFSGGRFLQQVQAAQEGAFTGTGPGLR